jgi:bifunctional non-homologous end joining protein LigD
MTFSLSVKSGMSTDEIASGEVPAPTKKTRGDGLNKLLQLYPRVQLATLVEEPPPGAEWLHEIKLDGYRLLGFSVRGVRCLRTRNGKDWTAKFPSLSASLQKLKVTDAVLDMEAVVVDNKGKSSFQALQAALGANPDLVIAYVFDLLYLNGKDLTKRPLRERKERLHALLSKSKGAAALRYSEHIEGHGGEMLAKACGMGLEGIVSKQADASYLPGRQRSWLKSKCAQRQEFIIIGYSDARKGERALGALYLGYRTNGKLNYAGKVGTGFSMKSARSLAERLENISVREPVLTWAGAGGGLPKREWQSIHWVKPVLLCEVDFTEWTKDGQLRHPSFQGLREDKDADDVKKDKPLQDRIASPVPKKTGSLILHGITITHPDRVISETGHITKGDLAEYYAAVAPFMLPRISRHPLSLLRCPAGIDRQCFYQRNPGKGLGPDVHPFKFRHKGKNYEYLYIEDEKGLLELVQMGSIEIHPWGASIDAIDRPDRLIFDLDPAPDVPFEAIKLAAQDLRQRLKRKGLESMLKCTGGKGLHVTVPLASKDEWPDVKSFAAAVANEMVDGVPEAYIATMSKTKRRGKIFVDYFRNDYTATAIADYAVRARPGAPVALPLEWKELDTLKSASQFTMKDVLKRLDRKNPLARSKEKGQRIPLA